MHDFTIEKSRHYVLDNLLCWLGVHLVLIKWFKETNFVSYLTYICSVLFQNFTSGKIRHYMLANLLCWFGPHFLIDCFHDLNSAQNRHCVLAKLLCWLLVHFDIEKWFKQRCCVRCFTKIHSVFLYDPTIEKKQTICVS